MAILKYINSLHFTVQTLIALLPSIHSKHGKNQRLRLTFNWALEDNFIRFTDFGETKSWQPIENDSEEAMVSKWVLGLALKKFKVHIFLLTVRYFFPQGFFSNFL